MFYNKINIAATVYMYIVHCVHCTVLCTYIRVYMYTCKDVCRSLAIYSSTCVRDSLTRLGRAGDDFIG